MAFWAAMLPGPWWQAAPRWWPWCVPAVRLGVLDQLPVEVLRGDLRELTAWEHGLQGCAFCFHVAALYALAGAIEALYEINVSGTDRLLAACARAMACGA